MTIWSRWGALTATLSVATYLGVDESNLYVGASETGGNLMLSVPRRWRFRDLLCGAIGVRWQDGTLEDSLEDDVAVLAHMLHGGGDEWELC